MKAMLNLANIKKPTLPIPLADGTVLNLLPASKALIDKMQAAGTAQLNGGTMYALAADILSCNTDNQTFTADDLSGLDIWDVKKIFTDYKNFILEIKNDPN